MFCSKCRTEYMEGVTRCADCGADLLEDLPSLKDEASPNVEFQSVLSTFNPGDVAFISSLLEGEGISFIFQGENFNRMRPMVEPVRLLVRSDQVDEVRELLQNVGIHFAAL